jgi:uncharacterized protein YlzI (FlbEa/FlbD family)
MKLVTVTKLDGQPAVINLEHVVVLFPNGEGSRIVLSNGMDIYVKAPLAEVQRQLDEAPSS